MGVLPVDASSRMESTATPNSCHARSPLRLMKPAAVFPVASPWLIAFILPHDSFRYFGSQCTTLAPLRARTGSLSFGIAVPNSSPRKRRMYELPLLS